MSTQPHRAWRALAIAALLTPLLARIVTPLLRGQTFFHEDILYYFQGLREQLGHAVMGWTPAVSGGLPFLGDGQAGVFDPLNLPYYLLPTEQALPASIAARLAIASALTWGWMRRLGASPWGAALGGLVFLWTGFFWHHLHHLGLLASGMWLPGALWAADVMAERRGAGTAALAVLAALSLVGGSPQITLYVAWASLLWAFARGASSVGDGAGWRRWMRAGIVSALPAAGAWALGAAMAAPALLPFAAAAAERFADPDGAYARSVQFALHPLALGRALVPDLLGSPFWPGGYHGFTAYWEEGASVGVVTLPLLVVGAMRGVGGARGRTLALILAGAALGMLGTVGLIHPILFVTLPGYALFRAPARLYLLVSLAAGSLAALGLTALERPGEEAEARGRAGRASRWVGVLGAELLGLCALYVWQGDPGGVAVRGLLVAAACLAATVALARGWARAGGAWVGPTAVALLLFEVLATSATFNLPVPLETARALPAVTRWLGEATAQAGGRYRVLWTDEAPPRGLDDGMRAGYLGVRGYNPLNSARWLGLLATLGGGDPAEIRDGIVAGIPDPDARALRLVAARWRVGAEGDGPAGHRRVFAADGLVVWEAPDPLPRAFVAGPLTVEPDGARRAAAIRAAAVAAAPPLILAAPPQEGATGGAAGEVTSFLGDADEVTVGVRADGPTWLVLADTFAAGWTATVDGSPAPIQPAYDALRAVAIPSRGDHLVRFAYRPPGLALGAGLAAAGAAGTLAAGILAWRRRAGLSRRSA